MEYNCHLIITLICITISLAAYAKTQCQGLNNDNDKVTIVFTDEDAGKTYPISEAKLATLGKEYAATSLGTSQCEEWCRNRDAYISSHTKIILKSESNASD